MISEDIIMPHITSEPQTVAQIAELAGIKPHMCAGYLRTLNGMGMVRLGVMQKGHSKTINTYRLPDEVKRVQAQREEYRGGPLPLRYEPKETQRVSFYRGVHTPAHRA